MGPTLVRGLRNRMPHDADNDLLTVRNLVAQVPAEPDALIPLLHDVQARLGYVPKAAIQLIAKALNLSRAEVHGVVTFYHDFREEPTADHVVQLCMAEACQAVGCRSLAAHVQETLGLAFHDATPDGRIQLESAYCFGNCAAGPSVRIGDRVHGRVTNESLDALMAPLRVKGREA